MINYKQNHFKVVSRFLVSTTQINVFFSILPNYSPSVPVSLVQLDLCPTSVSLQDFIELYATPGCWRGKSACILTRYWDTDINNRDVSNWYTPFMLKRHEINSLPPRAITVDTSVCRSVVKVITSTSCHLSLPPQKLCLICSITLSPFSKWCFWESW